MSLLGKKFPVPVGEQSNGYPLLGREEGDNPTDMKNSADNVAILHCRYDMRDFPPHGDTPCSDVWLLGKKETYMAQDIDKGYVQAL